MDKKKWPNLKLPSKNTEGDSQGVLTQEYSLVTSLRIDLIMGTQYLRRMFKGGENENL